MAEKSQSFRDVLVWQKAHALALAVYRCTEKFPKHEMFVLTSQTTPRRRLLPALLLRLTFIL